MIVGAVFDRAVWARAESEPGLEGLNPLVAARGAAGESMRHAAE